MSEPAWRKLNTFEGTVREAALTVIGDHYGVYGRLLRLDTDLYSDLNSDSITCAELLMTLEELFDVRFDPCAADQVRTVADVIDLVDQALKDVRPPS
jgi:acyl carrier protein